LRKPVHQFSKTSPPNVNREQRMLSGPRVGVKRETAS
jgi:hypothetical protein